MCPETSSTSSWSRGRLPVNKSNRDAEKVAGVTAIYNALGIKEETEVEIQKYFDKGLSELSKLSGDTSELHGFAMSLMAREN